MIHTVLAKNKIGVGVGIVQYEDENGLQFLSIENNHATATIAMQGGHVMHWQPNRQMSLCYGCQVMHVIQKDAQFVGEFLSAGLGLAPTQPTVVIARMDLHGLSLGRCCKRVRFQTVRHDYCLK